MPSFTKLFKSKDASAKSKHQKPAPQRQPQPQPPKPKWDDAWTRKSVHAEEVRELLHVCIQEMKSRDLDTPFLLLPFRPSADPSAAKNFIRSYFRHGEGPSPEYTGADLQRETRLLEPLELCSIIKWCWSRISGGIIGWNAYELFKSGEEESNMAKNAFNIFIPISVENSARRNIILDFFDFLAAIAANGKSNGLGGRKLSRLAGWWAFEYADTGSGFDGGYKSWARAADATSHLFFAYLRSKTPDEVTGATGISQLPRSLLALVSQTEYPPEAPTLLHRTTPKVVMIVEKVSPTPYALLQRASTFDYEEVRGDVNPVLVRFGDCEDPVQALTLESRRVLDAISSTNASADINYQTRFGDAKDASWSRFENIGFTSLLDVPQDADSTGRGYSSVERMRTKPASGRNEFDRPTTPSWADFLSSGFGDDAAKRTGGGLLTLPPSQMLPPITPPRVQSSQSHVRNGIRYDALDAPELNATSHLELDETFWWVWMSSLAGEEPAERKAVFGRCAFVETEPNVTGGGWIVLEEQVKGAAAPLNNDVKIVEKKSRFTFGRKSRQRRLSAGKKATGAGGDALKAASSPTLTHKPTADQEAKIHQAAADLIREQQEQEDAKSEFSRRGRRDEGYGSKTNSVMTLGMGPMLSKEAAPAMQWARKFDKDSIRERYLGDPDMGTGTPRAVSMASTMDLISATKPALNVDPGAYKERDLPPTPLADEEPTQSQPVAATSQHVERTHDPSPPPQPATHIAQQYDEGRKAREPVSPVTPRASESQHRRKASEKSTVSPDDLNHTSRKPVGGGDNATSEHPAFRKSPERTQANGSTGPPKPAAAAAAAAAAMKHHNDSQLPPSDAQGVQRSKVGSTRKFKNLFTRKRPEDSDEPEALAMHRAISAKNKGNTLKKTRPASRQEERPPPVPKQPPPSQPAPVQPSPSAPAVVDGDFEGEPGPEVETEPDAVRSSQRESDNVNRSTANFSNFTQGPLEDQPAFVGDDDEDTVSEPERQLSEEQDRHEERPHSGSRSFKTRAAERLYASQESEEQAAEAEEDAARSTGHGGVEAVGQGTGEEVSQGAIPPPPSAPAPIPKELSMDRWAQIRKNAAERRSEEQGHGSRASQSAVTEKTDDGETSGEESIESRVARIRARVAQLTGGPQSEGAPNS